MNRMKYTCSITAVAIDELIEIAKIAEEVGWTSALMPVDQLGEAIGKLNNYRQEYGRVDAPFEIQALSFGFGIDEQRQRADIGVTDNVVMPWLSEGLGFDPPLEKKKDSLKRFADDFIHSR
jgi:hypothetical protein